ncbi:MAG: response regulator, partial [Nitrospirales bacterium]
MKKYANKSVLVAEDHPDGRRLVVLLLDKLGITNVVAVVNGQEAQEQLQGQAFDLLLADWHMPEMDGIELLKFVKADLSLKSMKVLMVTADDDHK